MHNRTHQSMLHFTRKERNGIMLICILIIFIAFLPDIYSWLFPQKMSSYSLQSVEIKKLQVSQTDSVDFTKRPFRNDGISTHSDEADLTDEMYDHAELHDELGGWQMIFGVDTIPAWRRKGCAAMLLQKVIEDAESQHRLGLVLTCKEQLIHYYEKFGFVNEGISESVHGNVTWYQMRITF